MKVTVKLSEIGVTVQAWGQTGESVDSLTIHFSSDSFISKGHESELSSSQTKALVASWTKGAWHGINKNSLEAKRFEYWVKEGKLSSRFLPLPHRDISGDMTAEDFWRSDKEGTAFRMHIAERHNKPEVQRPSPSHPPPVLMYGLGNQAMCKESSFPHEAWHVRPWQLLMCELEKSHTEFWPKAGLIVH